jgi:predicted amidophosphoribosyltransferase
MLTVLILLFIIAMLVRLKLFAWGYKALINLFKSWHKDAQREALAQARQKAKSQDKQAQRQAAYKSAIKSLEPITEPCCPKCGNIYQDNECMTCHYMRLKHVDQIRLALRFDRDSERLIKALKKEYDPLAFEKMMGCCFQTLADLTWQVNYVCYVPKWDSLEYNFSQRIAEATAKQLGVEILVIDKIRPTDKQKQMRRISDRRRNLKGAFATNQDLTDQQILICDDFSTSGTTFDILAELLKGHGAAAVYGLALSRRNWKDA